MTKRKKKEIKPWCWYCEREFDDESVLVQHQRVKHFKCNHCSKKLNTAGGLSTHMQQVHKEMLKKIPNTIPGRDNPDIEIFGTTGIPPEDLEEHIRQLRGEQQQETKKAKTDEAAVSADATIVAGSAVPGYPPAGMTPYPGYAPYPPAGHMGVPPPSASYPYPPPGAAAPYYPGAPGPSGVGAPPPGSYPPPPGHGYPHPSGPYYAGPPSAQGRPPFGPPPGAHPGYGPPPGAVGGYPPPAGPLPFGYRPRPGPVSGPGPAMGPGPSDGWRPRMPNRTLNNPTGSPSLPPPLPPSSSSSQMDGRPPYAAGAGAGPYMSQPPRGPPHLGPNAPSLPPASMYGAPHAPYGQAPPSTGPRPGPGYPPYSTSTQPPQLPPPAASSTSAAVMAGTPSGGLQTGTSAPSGSGASASAHPSSGASSGAAAVASGEVAFYWKDNEYSMEERRAQLERYKWVEVNA